MQLEFEKMNSWPKLQETLESTATLMQYKTKQKKKTAYLHGLESLNHAFQAIFLYCTDGSASTSTKLLIIENQHLFNDNNDIDNEALVSESLNTVGKYKIR